MRIPDKTSQILLIILTVIAVVASLKAARVVALPLAFAFFIAVLVNPIMSWCDRRFPHWVSLAAVLLVLTGVLGTGVGILALCAWRVVPELPRYVEEGRSLATNAIDWARQQGLPVNDSLSAADALQSLGQRAVSYLSSVWSVLGLFVVIVALLVLFLLEIAQYRSKIERGFNTPISLRIFSSIARMGGKFRRYLLIQAFTSVLTGILSGLWCLLIGVEFALIWGVSAFVLNFVPTLGSIIAIVPPTLFALISGGIGRSLATAFGLVAVQVILGNFVDPRLQGSSLKLSPFIVLLSIVFWGWVWGIPGALIGVPMTAAIAIFCQEFESLESIALLLSEIQDAELADAPKSKVKSQ